ncbi:MAG: hypothetical protein J5727_05595 [Kiritimatiellae bacterium]|nr:hypothetical protein [Kiritimatiellia bacterium]
MPAAGNAERNALFRRLRGIDADIMHFNPIAQAPSLVDIVPNGLSAKRRLLVKRRSRGEIFANSANRDFPGFEHLFLVFPRTEFAKDFVQIDARHVAEQFVRLIQRGFARAVATGEQNVSLHLKPIFGDGLFLLLHKDEIRRHAKELRFLGVVRGSDDVARFVEIDFSTLQIELVQRFFVGHS